MKILLTYTCLISCLMLNAQFLSKPEAVQVVNQLYELEVLSEEGQRLFTEWINTKDLRAHPASYFSDYGEPVEGVAKSKLLQLLAATFSGEYLYRTGTRKYLDLYYELQERQPEIPITPKQQDSLKIQLDIFLETFEGKAIEDAIPGTFSKNTFINSWSIQWHNPYLESHPGYGLVHERRSVTGKTGLQTIQDLLSVGLVSEQTAALIIPSSLEDQSPIEAEILTFLVSRMQMEEEVAFSQSTRMPFLESLRDLNILPAEQVLALAETKVDNLYTAKFEIIPYCRNARHFSITDYDLDPRIGFQQLFKDIQIIVPQLEYNSLAVEIFTTEMYGSPWQKCRISFSSSGQDYVNEFEYGTLSEHNPFPNDFHHNILYNQFYQGVNKLLKDLAAEQRLYFCSSNYALSHNQPQKFALILLNEEQAKAWGPQFFTFENHDNSFNNQNIQALVDSYRTLRLFEHLSEEEIQLGLDQLAANNINSYPEILMCFPKTVVHFDWETGNFENPYEALTLELAAISRGSFKPLEIVDGFHWDYERSTVPYQFKLGEKTYQRDLAFRGDWLDPDFMKLIEEALIEQKIDGRFYWVYDNGQEGGYTFLTAEQHAYLEERQPELFPSY